MASKQFSYAIILSLLLISACTDVEEIKVIYIEPSLNSVCPVQFCLTLSQFAATQGKFNSFDIITLNFLPGNHNLNTTLVVADIIKLSMIANSSSNISCQCSARLTLKNITQVSLQGMRFIGCGSNEISSVENFTVENSSFIGQNGSGTALKINQSNVTFANCSLLFNIISTYVGPLQIIPFWRKRPNYDVLTDSNYAFIGGAIMVTQQI